MSDKGVIKELGLEKYFWTILDSSQDDKSGSSSNSLGRKSQQPPDSVEKKRGQAIEQEIEAKPLTQEKNESVPKIKMLNKLATPSQENKPFFGSPNLFNGGSQDNELISKASLTASGRKSPFMNFSDPPLDAGFITFDPSLLQTNQKNAKSHTSLTKDTFSNVESNMKIKFTPAADEKEFRKQRSNSLDENDFALISQILEEEAKKSGNEEGGLTVKSLPVEHTKGSEENNKDLEEEETAGAMPTLKTASSKPIATNTESLARAQAMFANNDFDDDFGDDFDDQTFLPQNGNNITESPKLQTASFKHIPIKQDNLARVQNMLADNDEDDLGFFIQKNKKTVNGNMNNKMTESPKLQTASFKNIPIKQENLARVQNMFADNEEDDLGFFPKSENTVGEIMNTESPKLQTASFKHIPVKQENLARVQNMFDDNETEAHSFPPQTDNAKNTPVMQTASMKTLNFKQENLARVHNMFADNDEDDLGFFPKSENAGDNMNNKITESPKLQTASFKHIPVKQENLARVQNMFADNDDDDLDLPPKKSKNVANGAMNTKMAESPKLQTASFKHIPVQQENLARFQNMFADGDGDDDGLSFPPKKSQNFVGENSNTGNNSNSMPMLQTASFKPISIKQENLARSKNMFADNEDDGLDLPPKNSKNVANGAMNNKTSESPKLQTASFKHIPVKQESLARFQTMFADADGDDDSLSFPPKKNPNFVGENSNTGNNSNSMPMLQTASFKPISIKQENLALVKNIFADDNTEEQNFPPQDNNSNGFVGIQTASNKPLNVKQENMNRVQSMFAEDEDDELSAIFQKNKNRPQQKLTVNNNSILSRITNLFKEDPETSNGFKKQVLNNNKIQEQTLDTGLQNAEAFSRLMSQRSFSFKNPIRENNDTEMEIEPKLITASFKPIAIDEAKLRKMQNMLNNDEDSNTNPFNENSNFSRQSRMTVENVKDEEDTKKTVSKKPKFERVMKPENKEKFNTDSNPEITYKPLPPLIKGDENNVLPRDSDFLESAFNQLNQSQTNSNFEATGQNGSNRKSQFSDKNLEDAFNFLAGDSQDEAESKKEPLSNKLVVEEQKTKEKTNSAPSPSVNSGQVQQTKKVLKDDLRVSRGPKKIKLNTDNLKIPDNRFLTKSSTDAKSVKKNQGFKFTKENNSSSRDNSPQPDKTKNLKRSYNEISKDNKGIEFPKNPKVQAYNWIQDIKARKLVKPSRKTYFYLENLNKNYSRVSNELRGISVYTALDRKFICPCTESFSSQADVVNSPEDTCYCNGNLLIGWNDMMQQLLKEGLEANHLKETWIANHYRNIVWKLASIERKLCNFHPSKHLTADNVKKELEYRYYVEYAEGKRSVLQKIIEKDEFSSNHLVLLVGEILPKRTGTKTSYLIELSDGWYSVYFEIKPEDAIKNDKNALTNNQLFFLLVNTKKIYSGMKIHAIGMKIVNPKQETSKQEAPNPEGAPTETLVELDYNSVSRASWDAKLGLARSRCLPKNLLAVRNHGGVIPMIDVFVIKKYKLLEKVGGNVRQFQGDDEGNSKGKVFFKIRVGDAIIYYNPENAQKYQDVFCEIEISGISDDMYGQIKENERIRFYNLKSVSNPERNQSYYDNEKKKHFNHCLYLEFQRTSKFQTASAMGGTFKQDANKFREFAKENYKSYYFLTSLELIHTSNVFNFYQKDIRFSRNEIDMIGLILETTPSKIFGCIGNGHLFQIALHSKSFFSNIKLLEKKNTIINFRALQIHSVEKLGPNDFYCFSLRTNDYSSFGNLPASLQSEAENLNSILKDQSKIEAYREKISVLMKKF